jgi:hypothetical protein
LYHANPSGLVAHCIAYHCGHTISADMSACFLSTRAMSIGW